MGLKKASAELRRIAAGIIASSNPHPALVSQALRRVLAAVEETNEGGTPSSLEGDLTQQVQSALDAGFQLIRGLYDDPSSNVFWVVALSKNPNAWEPYRAQRHLAESDSYALGFMLDEDLTAQNMEGTMIYHPKDPADLEEGEEPQEANTLVFEPMDIDELSALAEGKGLEERVQAALTGGERWTDIRLD